MDCYLELLRYSLLADPYILLQFANFAEISLIAKYLPELVASYRLLEPL